MLKIYFKKCKVPCELQKIQGLRTVCGSQGLSKWDKLGETNRNHTIVKRNQHFAQMEWQLAMMTM